MTELPAGWTTKPLGSVAETALGKMLDRGRVSGLPEVRYLRNVNVQWDRIDTHDLLTMELEEGTNARERFGVEPGDLLVCEGGEIGRAAIWRGDGEYIAFQKALHRVRPHVELLSRFALHQFRHLAQTGALDPFSTGSTIRHLPQQQLRRVPVRVAPMTEQHRIVELLEGHLSRLDAANESVHLAARRSDGLIGSTLEVAGAASSTEPLAALADIQGGIQKQPKRAPVQNTRPFLRVANVTRYGLDLNDVHEVEAFPGEDERYGLKRGDLLVVEGNGSPSQVGRAALWDASIPGALHQNHLIRVRPRERLLPEFLEAYWNSPSARRRLSDVASSTSGLYTLSVAKLGKMPVSLPDLTEQRRIADRVSTARADVQSLTSTLATARQRSAALRRALLDAAFSGRLTGRDSDLDRAEEAITS